MAALAVITAFLIQNSRFGWGLFSIRDEEGVAEELGVPTFRYKMLAITVTGFLGAMSGAVAAQQIGYLTPEGVFNLTVPLFVIVMSVVGGRRHWLGPVIGALLIYSLQERLSNSGFDEWGQVVLGSILVLVILFAPEGIYERIRTRPRRAMARRRRARRRRRSSRGSPAGAPRPTGSHGLAAATAVLLLARPVRRKRRTPRARAAPPASTAERAPPPRRPP